MTVLYDETFTTLDEALREAALLEPHLSPDSDATLHCIDGTHWRLYIEAGA